MAGIACGNGRASGGRNRGVASKASILVVKLGVSVGNSYPRTTQLMQAIDFVIKFAIERGEPIAINISFGNNYGAHNGRSILESYINDMANVWKNNIIIGTGNEGSSGHHISGILSMPFGGEQNIERIELAVSEYETSLSVQLWKNYYDDFKIELISPSGQRSGSISKVLGTQRFVLDNTEILLYYGEPSPYNPLQEIYIEFIPKTINPSTMGEYITSGIWQFILSPIRIITGNYNMWLPTREALNTDTRFLRAVEQTTLTIPSTAYRAVSVGAYDGHTDNFAYFSGRGYTQGNLVKPDICAPGVDILSTAPGGGYTMKSGTSMATPFVTGSAALLMEWGEGVIIRLHQ